MAQVNLARAQQAQKHRYDKGVKPRPLTPGTQVLVSNTALTRPHGDLWQGPYVIQRALGPDTYEVRCRPHPEVNDLKEWHVQLDREQCTLADLPGELQEGSLPWWLSSDTVPMPVLDPALTPTQQEDLAEVLADSPGVFSNSPGVDAAHDPLYPYPTRRSLLGPMAPNPTEMLGHDQQGSPGDVKDGRHQAIQQCLAQPRGPRS